MDASAWLLESSRGPPTLASLGKLDWVRLSSPLLASDSPTFTYVRLGNAPPMSASAVLLMMNMWAVTAVSACSHNRHEERGAYAGQAG